MLPELHIEVLAHMPNQEMRLKVINYGGAAREVRVMGVIGSFGFFGLIPPSSYWRSGESRTVVLPMPVVTDDDVKAFVEGRDMGKRWLLVGTVGGASYRWPLRKAKKLSAERTWHRLFPNTPTPLDVAHSPVDLANVVDRNL